MSTGHFVSPAPLTAVTLSPPPPALSPSPHPRPYPEPGSGILGTFFHVKCRGPVEGCDASALFQRQKKEPLVMRPIPVGPKKTGTFSHRLPSSLDSTKQSQTYQRSEKERKRRKKSSRRGELGFEDSQSVQVVYLQLETHRLSLQISSIHLTVPFKGKGPLSAHTDPCKTCLPSCTVCYPSDNQQAALIFTACAIVITSVNLNALCFFTVPECLLLAPV